MNTYVSLGTSLWFRPGRKAVSLQAEGRAASLASARARRPQREPSTSRITVNGEPMIMTMLANRELAEVRERLDAVPAEVAWNGEHTLANFIRT